MAKRKKTEEQENTQGWLTTYGDLMSLLLTFFVLLLSFSTIEDRKVQEALLSLKGALGVLPKHKTVISVDLPKVKPPPVKQMEESREILKELQRQIENQGIDRQVRVGQREKGEIVIRLDSNLLFRSGSAELLPSAATVLEPIADWLEFYLDEYNADIRIEGHTDDQPIRSANLRERYPTNWELSTARAGSVMRFLRDNEDLPEDRFGIAGYAHFKPLRVPVDLPENRRANRRVEIVVIPKMNLADLPDEDTESTGVSPQKPLPDDDWPEPF